MTPQPRSQPSLLSRSFYLALGLWMVALVVVGFWPTYYGPLLSGTFDLKPIIEIHAVVFSGWIVLFVAQTFLVYTGRLKWHRKVGWFAVGYATLMVAVVITALAMRFSDHMAAGDIREAHRSLVISSVDLLLFSGFLTAAIAYRKKAQIHKRLIIVATVVLMGPAVGRMTFLSAVPLILFVLYSSPILFGMAFDFAIRRRVHAVYIIGLILHLVSLVRLPLQDSEAWFSFSKWVYGLFT
ncbi:MAG: hypothetical protein IIA64_12325 [Planctomycetes bacterium]|nr:hypothetical protein [Planctomycetota bacterium]